MNLRLLTKTIKHRSHRQQYHHVANRMLGNMEFARTMATCLHHNTHAGPNYRMPLLPETHDPEYKHDCLSKHSLLTMVRAAQRAQRNTTGYYTGYIQKRQPVGKFELRQASMNLRFLAKTIKHRSNRQQYHHVANRMLGDLEFRGHARPSAPLTWSADL